MSLTSSLSLYVIKVCNAVTKLFRVACRLLTRSRTCYYLSLFHSLVDDNKFLAENWVLSIRVAVALTGLLETCCYLPDFCVCANLSALCTWFCFILCLRLCERGFAWATVIREFVACRYISGLSFGSRVYLLRKTVLLQLSYNTLYLPDWLRRFDVSFYVSLSVWNMHGVRDACLSHLIMPARPWWVVQCWQGAKCWNGCF